MSPHRPLTTPACILIVEDHADSRGLLQVQLQIEGYRVVPASGCLEASEQAQHRQFDLCILDHCLEDGTGADLRRQLRKMHPAMPALYWTGTLYSCNEIAHLRESGDDYLLKPVESTILKAAIARLLAAAQPSP